MFEKAAVPCLLVQRLLQEMVTSVWETGTGLLPGMVSSSLQNKEHHSCQPVPSRKKLSKDRVNYWLEHEEGIITTNKARLNIFYPTKGINMICVHSPEIIF